MIDIREPRDFAEVFRYLQMLWRQEGTWRFLVLVMKLGREPSPAGAMWLGGGLIFLLTGGFALYMLITTGHAAFNTSSDGVNWGMAIATYAYFALMSSGLTMIAALPMVFGFKQFYPIAKRCIWMAIVTLVAGFAVLALELGHPIRMLWSIPTGMQVMSPMFWMGVFYTIDLVLLLIKFYLLWQGDWDSPLSRTVAAASFVAVILASGMLGLVFGSMVMRPMWYGSFTSIYFMLTAALCGAAAVVLAVYLTYGFERKNMSPALRVLAESDDLPKVFATLIGIALVMILTRFWTGLWSNLDGLEGFHVLVRSPLFHIELWLGLALPFVLMMHPATNRRVGWQVLSAIFVLLAMEINRYSFIVGGQLVPMFKGNWINSVNAYTPSLTEWSLTLMGWALAFTLYALGEKLFDLRAVPDHVATSATKAIGVTSP